MTRFAIHPLRGLVGIGVVLATLGGMTPDARGEGTETPVAGGAPVTFPLPFSDFGDTSDNMDDRHVSGEDECPYTDDGGRDVFYSILPTEDIEVTISLCGSGYDTRLYVITEAQLVIACNDDKCRDSKGDPTLRSEIECVALTADTQYFIGVDGFDEDASGPYTITVTECVVAPPFECPNGATQEGETCSRGTPDTFNIGCNDPENPVFSTIACDETICGTSWGFGGGGLRDTDWYQIILDEPAILTLEGEFAYMNGTLGFVQMNFEFVGSGNCAETLGLTPSASGGPGSVVSITTPLLPAGTHWFFVASDLAFDIMCDTDNEYWIKLTCQTEPSCGQCPGDGTNDGLVGFDDILQILSNWGPCPGP